jgi:dynein heavy chain
MEINLEVMKPVLFSGVSGVGKSAIVLDLIDRIRETKNYMSIVLNFSAQTTAIATQVPTLFTRLSNSLSFVWLTSPRA